MLATVLSLVPAFKIDLDQMKFWGQWSMGSILRALPLQALEAQELPSLQATEQPSVPQSPARNSQTGAVDAPVDVPLTPAAPPSMGDSQGRHEVFPLNC